MLVGVYLDPRQSSDTSKSAKSGNYEAVVLVNICQHQVIQPHILKTQFEIECRCGGHSVTKKVMTILQILVAKPKLWKNLYFYK